MVTEEQQGLIEALLLPIAIIGWWWLRYWVLALAAILFLACFMTFGLGPHQWPFG